MVSVRRTWDFPSGGTLILTLWCINQLSVLSVYCILLYITTSNLPWIILYFMNLSISLLCDNFPNGGKYQISLKAVLCLSVCLKKLEWNIFNYSYEIKIALNVSVKYSGLPRLSISGSALHITIQQCPKYLNKVLITYISESSIQYLSNCGM